MLLEATSQAPVLVVHVCATHSGHGPTFQERSNNYCLYLDETVLAWSKWKWPLSMLHVRFICWCFYLTQFSKVLTRSMHDYQDWLAQGPTDVWRRKNQLFRFKAFSPHAVAFRLEDGLIRANSTVVVLQQQQQLQQYQLYMPFTKDGCAG